jgi:polyisoprenoid-binding protein YceI
MDIYKWTLRLPAVLLVTGWMSLAGATGSEGQLCEPFRDAGVDSSLLATMLDAARDGYLYRIQPDTSQVGFCVKTGFAEEVKGDFRDFKGGIALTPASLEVEASQAMIVIHTASLGTSNSVMENVIKGKQFFDVEHYPEILFVSRGYEWTGRDTASITGDLTVHGVTRAVAFDVTLTPSEKSQDGVVDRMLVKATTTIRRSDFEMDSLSQLVDDSVRLCMSVEVVRYTG